MTRLEMGKQIVSFEARRDKQGRLKVYNLPANDGGGRFEVAGINEKYDHDEAVKLRGMIQRGEYEEAEVEAATYIAGNTDKIGSNGAQIHSITNVSAVEFVLRDIVFNRGASGAGKTLQLALNELLDDPPLKVDGNVGPKTVMALKIAELHPGSLINNLAKARAIYEKKYVGTRPNFQQGLENRWAKVNQIALNQLSDSKTRRVA